MLFVVRGQMLHQDKGHAGSVSVGMAEKKASNAASPPAERRCDDGKVVDAWMSGLPPPRSQSKCPPAPFRHRISIFTPIFFFLVILDPPSG